METLQKSLVYNSTRKYSVFVSLHLSFCICSIHFLGLRIYFLGQLLFYECGFQNLFVHQRRLDTDKQIMMRGKEIEFIDKSRIDVISYHLILELLASNRIKVK